MTEEVADDAKDHGNAAIVDRIMFLFFHYLALLNAVSTVING